MLLLRCATELLNVSLEKVDGVSGCAGDIEEVLAGVAKYRDFLAEGANLCPELEEVPSP